MDIFINVECTKYYVHLLIRKYKNPNSRNWCHTVNFIDIFNCNNNNIYNYNNNSNSDSTSDNVNWMLSYHYFSYKYMNS